MEEWFEGVDAHELWADCGVVGGLGEVAVKVFAEGAYGGVFAEVLA